MDVKFISTVFLQEHRLELAGGLDHLACRTLGLLGGRALGLLRALGGCLGNNGRGCHLLRGHHAGHLCICLFFVYPSLPVTPAIFHFPCRK